MLSKEQFVHGLITRYVELYNAENLGKSTGYGNRITDAGLLLLAGKVRRHGPNDYQVESQTQAGVVYHVNGSCECADYDRAPFHRCKHRIAAVIDRYILGDMAKHKDRFKTHEHRYNCDQHHDIALECWEAVCKDPAQIACTLCPPTEPVRPKRKKRCPSVVAPEPPPADTSLASETDGWSVFVGETMDHDAPQEFTIHADPEDQAREEIAATLAEAERIAQQEKPLEIDRFQYEEAPVPTIIQAPLPEAPASLNLKFKVAGNHELMYTMRAHTDEELIARLPKLLAALESTLDAGSQQTGWFRRITQAVLPRHMRGERQEPEYVNGK